MQSIVEDFGHIASRLNEIANEKQPAPAATPVDDTTAWDDVLYGFTGIDDIYCG